MAYHWRDGITFERQADGSVCIEQPVTDWSDGQSFQATIPAAEWASIIAAVSAQGETAEQYAIATVFHNEAPSRREPADG